MSTTANISVPLHCGSLGLPAVPLTVIDRDVSVDVTPGSVTFSSLPAATWTLNVHISSTPATGAGPSFIATATSGSNAASLSFAPSTTYHAYKDFENSVNRTVYVTAELLKNSVRFAVGTTSYNCAAAAPARTEQVYALQLPIIFFDATKPASYYDTVLAAAADVLQPISGHPERTVIRCGMHWAHFTTGDGVYDTGVQNYMDYVFSSASSLGLGIMLDIAMLTPAWARAAPPWGTASGKNVAGTSITVCNGAPAPDDWSKWTDFVNYLVGRYCTLGLTHVQCGNEPNANRTSNWRDTNANYATSHIMLNDQVKTTIANTAGAFPVKVGLPNLSLGDTAYMDSMYSNGLLGHYDAISWHPYSLLISALPHPRSTNYAQDRRIPLADGGLAVHIDTVGGGDAFTDHMLSYDSSVRLWITETGVSYGIRSTGEAAYDTPEARGPDQWTYILRQAARLQRVDMVDIWGIWDYTNTNNATLHNWGLMRNDKSKRPAYAAVKSAIAAIRAGTM